MVAGSGEVEGLKALVSGSFAGACSTVAGAPFDTLKTRLQTNSARFNSLTQCLLRTVREETPLSLYKGVSPALTSAILENSVVFAANSFFKTQLSQYKSRHGLDATLSLNEMAFIGGFSGIFSAIAICPAEVCKVRMQAQLSLASSASAPQFTNSFDCFRQTFRDSGPRGLFRGLPAQIARDVPFNFAFFGAYETICKGLCIALDLRAKEQMSNSQIVLAGGLAGVAGWTVSLPMDVIKSRMQVQGATETHGILQVVRKIWTTQGFVGFFKGWSAAALRAFPCNGALFLGYEFCHSFTF